MILLTTQGSHIISVPESMYDKEIVLKFERKKLAKRDLSSYNYDIPFIFNLINLWGLKH